MKRIKTVLPLLLLFLCNNPVSGKGIHFEKASLSALMKKAEKEKKLIFIDVYATWCPPCRRMEKNVFPNDSVGDFYNSNFVSASFNFNDPADSAQIIRYEIGCFPTYLFLDAKGNLLHRASGEYPVADFIAIGKTTFNPQMRFSYFDQQFKSGKSSPEEMLHYLQIRHESYISIDSVLDTYMKTQPDNNLSSRANWNLLNTFHPSPSNYMFQYMVHHQQEFFEKYTKDSVVASINFIYSVAMNNTLFGIPDTVQYLKLRNEVREMQMTYMEVQIDLCDLDYYTISGNQQGFAKTACRMLRENNSASSMLTGILLYKFAHAETDTVSLDTAIYWAELAVKQEPNYYTTRDYALLLYKRGRMQEAETQALLAIKYAEEAHRDPYEEKEMIEKIHAKK